MSYLQSIIQSFSSQLFADVNDQQKIVGLALKSAIESLLKGRLTTPDLVLRVTDDELVAALCKIKVALNNPAEYFDIEFDASVNYLDQLITKALTQDVVFSKTEELEKAITKLKVFLEHANQSKKKKRKSVGWLSLLVTLLPALGIGTHFYISNYLAKGFIDEVYFVYPDNVFEVTEQKYAISRLQQNQAIEAFAPFYFRRYLSGDDWYSHDGYGRNISAPPLPLAYDQTKDELGIFSDDFTFAHILSDQHPDDVKQAFTNLIKIRVFVRNVRDSNIINQLKVRINKSGENAFPWQKINLTSDVSFNIQQDYNPLIAQSFALQPIIKQAPIMELDIKLTALLSDSAETLEAIEELEDLIVPNEEVIRPQFSKTLIHDDYMPHAVYVSPAKVEALRVEGNLTQLIDVMRERDNRLRRAGIYSESVIECEHSGMVIIASSDVYARIFDRQSVTEINFDYSYLQIDGKRQSTSQSIAFENPVYAYEDTVDFSKKAIEKCVGRDRLSRLQIEYMAHASPPGSGWLNMLEKLSSSVSEQTTSAKAKIALKSSFLFVLDKQQASFESSNEHIAILEDNDYLQFDIWIAGFDGGDHTIGFYIDNEIIDEFTVELFWPDELTFHLASFREKIALSL